MSSFIESRVGIVSPTYMVRFSPNIEQQKQFYNCKANDLGVVCSYNEWTNPFGAHRCLLKNHLHGKAAELRLANS